ncbi:MAG: beta-ketoacyl-[acyl-carrier-protein] synthase family protein [Planctomycetota bacterium]|nr:MAG: beta-ketoacyl-[acyl-carrier-protein] synthase family protein [Planctomycetota bacterium]
MIARARRIDLRPPVRARSFLLHWILFLGSFRWIALSKILANMQRVFISGLGTLCPLGNDLRTVWDRLLAGVSGISTLTNIDTSDLEVTIGGEVRGFDPRQIEVHDKIAARRLDRSSMFAVGAAVRSLADAGIDQNSLGSRGAVVLGAGLSGLLTLQEQTELLLNGGPRKVSPLTIPLLMPNASAANIAIALGLHGTTYTVSSACASSGHAMINAAQLIRSGAADVVITGGTEASLTRLGMASFINMRAMAKGYNDRPSEAVRPFDAHRGGLIMSEGAACLVFESEEHLRRRGGRAYAELLGQGATSDAFHITQPDPSAREATRAIEVCLASCQLKAGSIANQTYVNAHGTGTRLNDVAETRAIRLAFGVEADQLLISSTKSMTGHLIGAAGGLELAICCLGLIERQLPGTINLTHPDSECDLNYLPNASVEASCRYAMNLSFGFGGHNVCQLIGVVDDATIRRPPTRGPLLGMTPCRER